MNRIERKGFIQNFLPGLVLLILVYVFLTIIRDYRSNFASNIWTELGMGNDASVFLKSELPASILTLVLLSLLVFIKKNITALLINHLIIGAGFLISILSTVFYLQGSISPFWWMTIIGIGLYTGYVPFNCMLFERLIASFKYVSNAGFLIYLADSFGYMGSDAVLITKNFMHVSISWSDFFVRMVLWFSSIGFLLISISAIYFRNKYFNELQTSKLSYV